MSAPASAPVFHITTPAAWAAARAAGALSPASLATEGFVHLSRRDQVLGSANRHFAGQRDLLVLELDPARLAAPLRWEAPPGRPDERYPHLYGPLPAAAVVATHPLAPGPDGRFAGAPFAGG